MKFQPKTEEELEAEANENLLPAGTYDFEVLAARERTSKSGNPMIEVEVEVFHDNGSIKVKDFLMEAMQFKLLHFCEVAGLESKYAAGDLEDVDCIGVTGKCKIRIEKGRKKENGDGNFRDKNSVQDYVKPGEVAAAKTSTPASTAMNPPDDDLPF